MARWMSAAVLSLLLVVLLLRLGGEEHAIGQERGAAPGPAAPGAAAGPATVGVRPVSGAGGTQPPAGWQETVLEGIRALEYHFSSAEDGEPGVLTAPNRAQGLRSRMGSEGVSVRPRRSGEEGARDDGWELTLRLSRFGRGGDLCEVEPASPMALENRIEYRRGGIREWYLNDERGLEQGFDLLAPPPGVRGEPVVLEMDLGCGLQPQLSEDRQAVTFSDGGVMAVLRYGELWVADATGAAVAAELALEAGVLAIVFDDSGAVYPLHVDPLMTSPAWTAEGDQAGARFGLSVATAGDVNGDGYSDVIAGAPFYDNGQSDEGGAFLYLGSAAGLGTTAAWTAESDQAGAGFGVSVATAGDVNGDGYSDVVAGAYVYTNGQASEGRAFLYLGSAAGLGTTAAWTAESDQAGALFGGSVATAGDVNGDGYSDVIAGAPFYDNGQTNEGRAFLYLGSVAGLATTAAWTAESDQTSAVFGHSVATAGDVNGDGYSDVVAGAYDYDNGQTDEGRAFLYLGSAAGLATTAGWSAESNQAGAEFGYSVATAGDVNADGYSDVIVGARDFDAGQSDEGRAFVYLGSAAGLSAAPAWTTKGNQAGARFGSSVSAAGDVDGDGCSEVLIGAPGFDDGQTDEGRAFLFCLGFGKSPAGIYWQAEGDQAGANFGVSVATAGDVNGDGYPDVIVGALAFAAGETDEGRAFVYHGSADGLSAAPAWTAEGNQTGVFFGRPVATAGDVNGDGYSDVIVGAYLFDNAETDEGRAFVYHGSAEGLSAAPAWTAEGNQAGVWFGYSVATAGDVNGDGFSDVLVGANQFSSGQFEEGGAFVYLGSAAGLATTAAWTAEGDQVDASFGDSVATAGDVNGDGYSDVMVGAHLHDNGQFEEGQAFVYLGSAAGLATTAAWTAESNQSGAQLGLSVSTAGDVNGDGYSDVVAGAFVYDNGQNDEGRVFLYYGNSGDGLDRIPRQALADGSAPIHILGGAVSRTSFRLRALGRSPEGRGRVALAWEVKPLGTAFDGSGLGMSAFTLDTGAPGASGSAVSLDELVESLTPGTPYHWRLRLLTENPFFPRSPWLSLPYNSRTETDLRTTANRPPVAACQDIARSADSSCQAAVGAAEMDGGSSDPEGDALTLSLSPPGPFALGATAVTLTVTDAYGAQDACLATVTVADTTAPSIACPADATVSANASCGYTGAIPGATATDNCTAAATITLSHNAPATLPLGMTTVTWTATDGAGNSAACSYRVTVVDTTRPIITCPADATVSANAPCAYTGAIPEPAVSDNCTATGSISLTSDAPAAFPLGMTTVTWTATDGAGNSAACSYRVTVVDTTRPSITCPADATVTANSSCAYTGAIPQPAVADNCTAAGSITLSSDAPAAFPLGMTTVTWTATDGAGNSASCTYRVTVADTTPPAIVCPQDIAVDCAGPGGTAVDFTVSAADGCDPAPALSCSPAPGSVFPEGVTTVECTARDGSGNTSTCSFEVRVSTCGGRQLPGDCNQDGTIDISDAICLLGFLYLGSPPALPCGDGSVEDAANDRLLDWNDQAGIDLSDVIAILNWLFQGGSAHVLGELCQPVIGCPDSCVPE